MSATGLKLGVSSDVSALYWGAGGSAGYEAEMDFTSKSPGAMPSTMDTGQAIVLTWNTTVNAKPVISNVSGKGNRYTIAATDASAQAGYVTCQLTGVVTKMIADYNYGVGLQAWRDQLTAGLLANSTEGANCHFAAGNTSWTYSVWTSPLTLETVQSRTFTTGRSATADMHIEVTIDPTGFATVLDDESVTIRVPASGTDSRLNRYTCPYACCEIYYNNASTEPRANVATFKATSAAGGAPSGYKVVNKLMLSDGINPPQQVWPVLFLPPYSDNFNRGVTVSPIDGRWVERVAGVRIASDRMEFTNAGANTLASYADPVLTDDHKVSAKLVGTAANIRAMLFLRANPANGNSVQFQSQSGQPPNILSLTSGAGWSSAVNGSSSRITGTAFTHVVNDVLSLEAIGQFYIARRNGVAVVIWFDTAGVQSANVGASNRSAALAGLPFGGATTVGLDDFTFDDIPAGTFYPSRMTKSGTLAWATTATWVDITAWAAVNDATYTSHITTPALTVITSKTGATLAASVPYTGSTAGRTHKVRIVRTRLANGTADSTVIATQATDVTTAAGTASVSVTADVAAGEQYKVQMQGSAATAGTITATTPTFTIS